MSDNRFDIYILKAGKGWEVKIDYWYYSRDKKNPRMTSHTSYTWYTECEEIVNTFQQRRTKVFYSQLRVLARMYGRKRKERFNFTRNIKII